MDDLIRLRFSRGQLSPVGTHAAAALAALDEGEIVYAGLERQRSEPSHRHFFAVIANAWRHLPESLASEVWAKSSESMRKHALIATGFCNVKTMALRSRKEAVLAASYMLQMGTLAHGYAIASVDQDCVLVWTPESQSRATMGAKRFQQSKQAVMDWIAAQIGVDAAQLEQAG